jgi:1,4-alpha-glucan branching enzyme
MWATARLRFEGELREPREGVLSSFGKATRDDRYRVPFQARVYHDYRVGVPLGGRWEEKLNSDSEHYGGSGQGNLGGVDAEEIPADGHPYSVSLTLPALAALFFTSGPPEPRPRKKSQKMKTKN